MSAGLAPRLIALGLTAGAWLSYVPARAAESDLPAARRQFHEFFLGSDALPEGNLTLKDTNEAPPDADRAVAYARDLRPDGSWADLDYASNARSGWPPSLHYTRMLAMVAAANRHRDPARERSDLLAAVHRAFAFWIARDFQCPNWWYNQIGTPKILATVALLLDDALAPAERDYVTRTLRPRTKIGMTGQNKVWLAGNTLMIGLLANDEALVAAAADTIWSEVTVSENEGIQADFSFHQHGPQQQFGNYGLALAVEVCRWGSVLRGTPWAMPPNPLAAYRGFLLNGEAWVNWRGRMDISACGRQFMPHSQAIKSATIAQVMRNIALFHPAQAAVYASFEARNQPGAVNDLSGDRYFWRSDYLVHRTTDFAATLKMCSRRVVGAESLNNENLLGYHLADGALYLYRAGDEYDEIFPVWDWRKLPGVTCGQEKRPLPAFREYRIDRDFVGGVTDGVRGCAALDYSRDGVVAKKAWFFGVDGVVCLGAAIASETNASVGTTLNQCLLRGAVAVKRTGHEPATASAGESALTEVEWVEHDNWRYVFLEPTAVHLRLGPQTGNWRRVFNNPSTPTADVTRDVFTLWLDHGSKPGGDRYAYAIVQAGAGAAPRISLNSELAQVVQVDARTVAAVFWRSSRIELAPHFGVAVDQPCVLLVDLPTKRAFVADPTQKLRRLTLIVNGVTREVALPGGGDAGRSVEVRPDTD